MNRDRKAEIIGAATRIASETGIATLTVRAVAARAGCGIGTLRHHFPSQQELVDAVLPNLLDATLNDEGLNDEDRPRAARLAVLMMQFMPPANGGDEDKHLSAWFELYASALSTAAAPGTTRMLEILTIRAHQHVRSWLRTLAPERADDAPWLEDTADSLVALCGGLCLEAFTPGSPITLHRARHILGLAANAAFSGQER